MAEQDQLNMDVAQNISASADAVPVVKRKKSVRILLPESTQEKKDASFLENVIWFPVLAAVGLFSASVSLALSPAFWLLKFLFGMQVEPISLTELLKVPLEKRKQTLAVSMFVLMAPLVSVMYFWTLILLIFPPTTFITFCYCVFIYFDKASVLGSRTRYFRNSTYWDYFVEYFPIRLQKTVDIPNVDSEGRKKNYVFCYHPHGIISFGALANFASNATGFDTKFPGLDLRVLTLKMNFFTPLLREALLFSGLCEASREACDTILNREWEDDTSNAIMLVVGGAQESMDAAPGTYRLTLHRKGFVRVALNNGAELVPVLAFGETDVFNAFVFSEDTWMRRLQNWFKHQFGFAAPMFFGQGFFNRSFGLLPHRKPIIVVVGEPVPLPDVPEHLKGINLVRTQEGAALVDKYHEEYKQALIKLYNEFKNKWAKNRVESLRIISADRRQ